MIKISCFFIFLFFIFSLSFVSSNFACGIVNNSNEFSSSWINVVVYYNNYSDFSSCKINPENKFCCDLEELKIKPTVGDAVFAEVFDDRLGLVSPPVSSTISGEGYDIFPIINMEKAIEIDSHRQTIFINQSLINFNISLSEDYPNLNYTIVNSNGSNTNNFCYNCTNFSLPLILEKGRNDITFTAFGKRKITENISLYNLDYLNFNLDFFCRECKLNRETFFVPSGKNITILSSINSSHDLNGNLLLYFPEQWIYFDSFKLEDFSPSHNLIREEINGSMFSINYTFQTPKTILKNEYSFFQEIENFQKETKVQSIKYKLMPIHRKNIPDKKNHFIFALSQKGSPNEPILIETHENYLEKIAIIPNKNIINSKSALKVTSSGKRKISFMLLTTIPNKDIDKIFIVFKAVKDKDINVFFKGNEVPLDKYGEDSNYFYYSAFFEEKGLINLDVR